MLLSKITSENVKRYPTTEILWIQYKYVHTTFNIFHYIPTIGVLPKRLVGCPFPVCSDFLYGNSTKRPCKIKIEISINESKPVVSVGDCVYFDVLVSITPVLVVYMYGFITHQFYQYACVFMGLHCKFTYVHLLKSQTIDESVVAKETFEIYVESHGVDIKNYRSDNWFFRIALWIKQCKEMNKGFTYSGVSSHHQHGRLDMRIR